MPLDRRRLLRYAPYLASPSLLTSSFWSPAGAAKPEFPAALLVPKSGEHAALGRSMERAAMLAQGTSNTQLLHIYDTVGTLEGAFNAAKAARHGGASIVLGPVFASELPGVLKATGGSVPIISFSNDSGLRESGAFILGITASQIVSALLHHAANSGIRRIGSLQGSGAGWDGQVAIAAAEVARSLGLELITLPFDWAKSLPAQAQNDRPEAVLIVNADQLASSGQLLTRNGVKVLGAIPGLELAADALRGIEGAWFASPDPAIFASFSKIFEGRVGSPPGLITGLAYDAVRIVQKLRSGGGVDRSALLAAIGFDGVCGTVRFREDGSAARSMVILSVQRGNICSVGPSCV